MSPKLEAYLQLSRISNLPTVWSNVLVGVALASTTQDIPVITTLLAMLALSLFYIGGMAQNDLVDLPIDLEKSPQRPLPSGALSLSEVRVFTFMTFGLGLLLIAFIAIKALYVALALLLCIYLYNLMHKKWNLSLIFMGLCRGLVYCVAAALIFVTNDQPILWTPLLYFAGLLAAYIIALTLVAQKETDGSLGYRKWWAIGIIVIPLLAHYAVTHQFTPALIITGIVLPLWLLRSARFIWITPPKVVPAILGWLAGICLVDAFFLALLDRPELSAIAGGCFIITILGHRRILGT